MSATDAPRPASDAAETAPLMPAPTTSTSNVRSAELLEVPIAQRHTEFTIITVAITLPIPTATGVA